MHSLAIGIDLGGTHIKGVLVRRDGEVMYEAKAETFEQDEAHWKRAVADMVADLKRKAGGKVAAIGLSAPGLADADNRCIAFMVGRLEGLQGFLWSDWIGERTWVLNDAHAALMAEAQFGAAKGLQHAVLYTLGTGVGGGILINGQLYQGITQRAGHIGHTSVEALSPKMDIAGIPGSIEDAIGNATLPERSQGRYRETEELVNDFKKGDSFAESVWITSVQKLAVSIVSVINLLSPEAVILSGGIIRAREALLDPLQNFVDLYEWRPGGQRTLIRLAHFSDRAGAIGAAAFAFSKTNP